MSQYPTLSQTDYNYGIGNYTGASAGQPGQTYAQQYPTLPTAQYGEAGSAYQYNVGGHQTTAYGNYTSTGSSVAYTGSQYTADRMLGGDVPADPNYSYNYRSTPVSNSSAPKIAFGEVGDGSLPRYRVLLLPDNKEVVVQIGLDGVKLLDKDMRLTLRVYPLDTISKWAVKEDNQFVFWSKTPVDRENKTVVLKSNSYVTQNILDVMTASCVQLCEMIEEEKEERRTSISSTQSSLSKEEKDSKKDDKPASTSGGWSMFGGGSNSAPKEVVKEERDHWIPDSAAIACAGCATRFSTIKRRHHCRSCGQVFCDPCTKGRINLLGEGTTPVRVCDRCAAEALQREEAAAVKEREKEREERRKAEAPAPSAERRSHSDYASRLEKVLSAGVGTRVSQGPREVFCDAYADAYPQPTSYSASPRAPAPSPAPRGPALVDITLPPHLWGAPSQPSAPPPPPGYHSAPPQQNYLPAQDLSYAAPLPPQQQEVTCPFCQMRLQVLVGRDDVPVECGSCRTPFLVAGRGY